MTHGVRFHSFHDEPLTLELGTPLTVFTQGSHLPVLYELEHGDGTPAGRWLVKTTSMYVHGATCLLRELAGSDLAAFMGLLTPRVGLLRMPESPAPTDESEAGRRAGEIHQADAGTLGFCSEMIDALPLEPAFLKRRGRPARELVRDAIFTFAFDATFWHFDRTWRNPNLLLRGRRLVAIDHDRICHGFESVDESGAPPDFADLERMEGLEEHVLRPFVRRYPDDPAWGEFADRASSLDEGTVRELCRRWPDELDRARNGIRVDLKIDLVRFILSRVRLIDRILREARRVAA